MKNPRLFAAIGLLAASTFALAGVAYAQFVSPTCVPPACNPSVIQNISLTGAPQTASINLTGSAVFSGNVGVGTTSPVYKLDVRGIVSSGLSDGEFRSYQDGSNYVSLRTDAPVAHRSGLFRNNAGFFSYYDTNTGDVGLDAQYPGAGLLFQIGGVEKMRVTNGGNVGIGTTSPGAKLEVNGQVKITGGSPGAGKVLTSDASGLASWQAIATGSGLPPGLVGQTLRHDGANWVANSNIFNDGTNVGIGTATPGAKLDVNGQVKITGGAPGAGKVLTSDADGLASWQTPTGGGTLTGTGTANRISKWLSGTDLGDSSIFDDGTNVGIGTTTPLYKLTVEGNDASNGLISAYNRGIGTGVYAISTSGYGIYSYSGAYTGVYGYSSGVAGIGRGVWGRSSDGYGVQGDSENAGVYGTSGNGIGVKGESNGTGVYGIGPIAIRGVASTSGVSNGIGVRGDSDTEGIPSGVMGYSSSATGRGVSGIDTNGVGVYGDGATWGFYTPDGAYLGGQIKIAGGSPGAGKVLTSDADGLATWQDPAGGSGAGDSPPLRFTRNMYAAGSVGTACSTEFGSGYALASVYDVEALWQGKAASFTNAAFWAVSYNGGNNYNNFQANVLAVDGTVRISKSTSDITTQVACVNVSAPLRFTRNMYAAGSVGTACSTEFGSGYALASVYDIQALWQGGAYSFTAAAYWAISYNGGNNYNNFYTDGYVRIAKSVSDTTTQVACVNKSESSGGGGGGSLTGSGTVNRLTKWLSGTSLGDSSVFDDGTNVGIGTTSPGAKLDIAGLIKIAGGTPGVGKVLTSDANGLASWEMPAAEAADAPALRITRGTVAYNASLATKDAMCVSEYGSVYQTASIADINANWRGSDPSSQYAISLGATTGSSVYAYRSTNGTEATFIDLSAASGNMYVNCVKKTNLLELTRGTVAYNASLATKDALCVSEYGSNYRTATINEINEYWSGVGPSTVNSISLGATTSSSVYAYRSSNAGNGGVFIELSLASGNPRVTCVRK